MKTYEFPYILELGKCDIIDGTFSCELDDNQEKRLIASAVTGKYSRLDEDETIIDIFDEVFFKFIENEKPFIEPDVVMDYFELESEDDVTDDVIDDYLTDYYGSILKLYYPSELNPE